MADENGNPTALPENHGLSVDSLRGSEQFLVSIPKEDWPKVTTNWNAMSARMLGVMTEDTGIFARMELRIRELEAKLEGKPSPVVSAPVPAVPGSTGANVTPAQTPESLRAALSPAIVPDNSAPASALTTREQKMADLESQLAALKAEETPTGSEPVLTDTKVVSSESETAPTNVTPFPDVSGQTFH